MRRKIAVVFGGTGFIGRRVVRRLAAEGYQVKVAGRVPERGYDLKLAGDIGQVVPLYCDYGDYDAIAEIVAGADCVVNCVGILAEKRRGDFERIHADIPESIAAACAVGGVGRLVHISALGIDKSTSRYAASKREGEVRVRAAYPLAVILRPSVVFGEGDRFFTLFARLAAVLPFLPLFGGGRTRFQPVYVNDVAEAVMRIVQAPITASEALAGVYELGGPDVIDFRGVYEKVFSCTGRWRRLVSIPFWLARVQALFLSLLPAPLLTPDQVESLKTDSIVTYDERSFKDLGIFPVSMDAVLPDYLVNYRVGGRFAAAA